MHGPIGDSEPMAFFDCPRGHRVASETRVFFQHGPDFSDCYFPSKSSVSRARRAPPGKMVLRDGTDSQPEALKLLVISNSWRRNVPPFSTRSA